MLQVQIITLEHEVAFAVATRGPEHNPTRWFHVENRVEPTYLYRVRRKDGSLSEFYGCELVAVGD